MKPCVSLFVSTLLFDDRNNVLHSHVPVAEMLPLTTAEYTIGGCTALLDAVGDAIQHAVRHQRHAKPERRAENVVFVIITDGLENAIRRFTNRQVQGLVARETKDYGWEFLYLGANIDAFAAAADIGIDKSHAANWVADASGIGTTFKDIGDAVCCMRESTPAAPYSLSSGAWKKRTDEDYRKRGKK